METLVKRWLSRLRLWLQDERGLSLAESIAAVAVVGVAVVASAVALSTGSIAVRELNQEVVAQSLVRNQLEFFKGSPYDTTYPTVDTSESYNITVAVDSIPGTDSDIQKITVTILRGGAAIFMVEDYRVNR